MLQVIEGKTVEVVDFDTMPELPITGLTDSETRDRQIVSALMGFEKALEFLNTRMTYAQALTDAIKTGFITEPGKYGIELHHTNRTYTIHKIIEL
jgi:hypothetical protein